MTSIIPDGYLLNAAGHLVPESQVRDHDKLRDQITFDLAETAERLNAELSQFKEKALKDIADLVSLSAERYNVAIGGKKGNVTLMTFDGRYKVTRSYSERITFTEELEAAKELLDRCIIRWSEGTNSHIRVLVNRAFRTNGQGHIRTAAVLDLLRVDIDDPEWKQAMEALKDSVMTVGSAVYVRIYRRILDTDQYEAIPLDLAAV